MNTHKTKSRTIRITDPDCAYVGRCALLEWVEGSVAAVRIPFDNASVFTCIAAKHCQLVEFGQEGFIA